MSSNCPKINVVMICGTKCTYHTIAPLTKHYPIWPLPSHYFIVKDSGIFLVNFNLLLSGGNWRRDDAVITEGRSKGTSCFHTTTPFLKKSHRLARMHGIQIFKADNAKRIWGDNWTHSQIILLNPIFETRNIITSRLSLQLCSPACFHRWGLSKRFSALVMWSGDDDDLI